MNVVELITRKRDGGRLTAQEIQELIVAYTADEIPDYQMSAFAMAVVFSGMDNEELASLTDAMLNSGDRLDLGWLDAPKIDKHSTGGVGDKASLPLAPLVAACGVAVPMMSGRGLGHTGGTLDKLESIPGMSVRLDPKEFYRVLERNGMVMAGQSETLVPADRRLYALRDSSGTVASIPLIASSIMSKKLAEDIDGLVLDVKVGGGATMRRDEDAWQLAKAMIDIGQAHDTPVRALLTDMSQPLGREVGNSNEIAESVAVLKGEGPPDVTEVTMLLGVEMLLLAGTATTPDDARRQLEAAVSSGSGMEVFAAVVADQGGDPAALYDTSLLPSAPNTHVVEAKESGVVTTCDAGLIGVAGVRLGGGRLAKEDEIDPGVGITVDAKVGEAVDAGDPLCTVVWRDEARLASALEMLGGAWEFGDEATIPPLLHYRVS